LFIAKERQYAADGLAFVGVLTDDPPEPARRFVADYGADWPTVLDPDKALKTTYRVAGRPQTYFIDGKGVIRSIQIGQVEEAAFDRQYAKIAP
jgi:cytochrome c biogenesis protein CcmG/thiol:disulfide interchange protein DsbE